MDVPRALRVPSAAAEVPLALQHFPEMIATLVDTVFK